MAAIPHQHGKSASCGTVGGTVPRRVAEALLSSLDGEDRALFATAIYAGLRRGELTALRWADVDLAAGVIRVRRGWDQIEGEIAPKSREGRRNVPVPAPL